MGIKNWTITAEGTKSASAREIYLHDKKHPNHRNTQDYLDVFGSDNTTLNIIRNTERHKLETARKRKGGRPPLEATEFVLTFPKGIRPDKDQWKQILSDVMLDVADNIGVDRKELAPICRAVAHQQDQNPEKKGAGDHMHVLIGRFTNDGKYLRALQSKSTLHRMKQSFNVAALDVMGVNHATYEPVKTYQGVAKKRAPHWKVKAKRVWETLKTKHKIVDTKSKSVRRDLESNEELVTALNKFLLQIEKWTDAFEAKDEKQMLRQQNRLAKSIEKLNTMSFGEQIQRAIDNAKEKVESASSVPLPDLKPMPTRNQKLKM